MEHLVKYQYREYSLNKQEKIISIAALFFALVIVGLFFYKSIIPIVFTPFFAKLWMENVAKRKCEFTKNELVMQFRDFLYSLSNSFSSGYQMEQALEEALVTISAIYGEKSVLAKEIESMIFQIKESRKTDLEVLDDFAMRSDLEDIRSFVNMYSSCRHTGGNMVKAINQASDIIGEKIEIERKIKSIYSQKILEGGIILAMPFILIFFLNVASPEYIEPLYTSMAGRILMTFCIVIMIFSYFAIRKIIKIEI